METLAPLVAVSLWKHLTSAVIRQDIERRFEYFGTVSGVSLYPVKGFGATRVQSARCGPLGLEVKGVRDRFIMVVDMETGVGRYMLHFPKMAFITTRVEYDVIALEAPGMDTLLLPHTPDHNNQQIICEIHASRLVTRDFGDEAARWVGKYLNNDKLRLVYYLESNNRLTMDSGNNRDSNIRVSPEDKIPFSGASSYLLANERTLEELAKLTPEPVHMDNFRPSIIIDGAAPFLEDTWTQIRIGDSLVFRCQESCKRCAVVNINPNTAERSKRNEPLKTMKRFKEAYGGVPLSFGVYAAAERGGAIRVGDPVWVLK
uniref:Mitochondrial amidoxime-reducing component 1-like n=1 Tax=Crassostrea virginica TaxID=6565 RepID=A0A8B8CPG4_CRAVI|nr:mitochondrial amidoxime-reducing component 1-like [Crassostrea virginica]